MTKIRFENGKVVNFEGDPTPEDINEIASQFEIPKKANEPIKGSLVTKSIDAASHVLGGLASMSTKLALAPLAKTLPISEEKKAAITEIQKDKKLHYGSDVAEIVAPFLKHTPATDEMNVPIPTPLGVKNINVPSSLKGVEQYSKEYGKTAARLAIDILTDPLSYVEIGLPTKLGRLVNLAHEAKIANIPIKLNSQLARDIANEVGSSKITLKILKDFKNRVPATTASEQVTKGERSLLTIINPITNKPFIEGVTGPLAGKLVKPLSLARRSAIGDKIESGLREMFSSKTGHPEYDLLVAKARDLTAYRRGEKIKDIKAKNKILNDLSREMGVPREVISRQISDIVEKAKVPTTVSKPVESLRTEILREQGSTTDRMIDVVSEIKGEKVSTPVSTKNLVPELQQFHNIKNVLGSKQQADEISSILSKLPVKKAKEQIKILNQLYVGFLDSNTGRRIINEFDKRSLSKITKGIYPKGVLDELQTHYEDKLVEAKVGLANAHKANDAVKVEQYAKDVVDYNSELNKLNGTYSPPPSINPKLDKLVADVKEGFERQQFNEETSGRQVVPLLSDRDYLHHATVNEAREARANEMIRNGHLEQKMEARELSTKLGADLHRQFNEIKPKVIDAWKASGFITGMEARSLKGKEGLDKIWEMLQAERITPDQYTDAVHSLGVNEVNKLSREGKLAKYYGDYRGDIFHTDPIYSSGMRGIKGEIARTNTEFYNELIKRKIAKPEAEVPGWFAVSQPELKGYRVPPEVAKSLQKMNEFYTKPSTIANLLRGYDRFHSLNKIWTLAPFPAYHTKNMVGNFWNNYLSGLSNPLRYLEAKLMQRGKDNKLTQFTDTYGNKWNTKKTMQKAEELGVIGHGQFGHSADIERTIDQELESGKWLTFSSRNQFLRFGIKIGKSIEDNARLAHFIDRLKKGDNAEQAALSVKKFLFDYGDLSDFERNVLNRVFFFYTWPRKNIPLQLHALVTTPGKFAIPFKAKYEVEKMSDTPDEKYLAEYYKENFPVRLRYNKETKQAEYFLLNSWLPAADILKLAHLHDIGLQMLSPIPKELLQQSIPKGGFDLYFKNKIQKYPGEKAKFLGMNLPVRAVHAAKTIRLLNEIDKLGKNESDLFSTTVGILTGKNATVDYNKARRFNKPVVDEKMKALMGGYAKAQSDGDTAEVNRIRELMKETAKDY